MGRAVRSAVHDRLPLIDLEVLTPPAPAVVRPAPLPRDVPARSRTVALPAWTITVVLAAVYLVANPPSADLAAATYRSWLFDHVGMTVWDGGWYGGHHVPGYSVLFPPLSGLVGPRMVGAIAAVVAAWAFERLAMGLHHPASRSAALWFAIGIPASLCSGRLTFAFGMAIALLAVLALSRDRLLLAAAVSAATGLGSPVAAAFLALAYVAWGLTVRRPWVTAGLVAATLAPVMALTVVFPEGGDFPFAADAFWSSLAATVLLATLIPREQRLIRTAVALYAILLILSAALNTPMGGNAVRLGAVFAGPVALLALWPDRRRALLLVAPALVYWQWTSAVDDVWRATAEPSHEASYYRGVMGFLAQEDARHGPFRVEVPFTDNHWESARMASGPVRVALARGWERQLDRKVNALFYNPDRFTAQRYDAWLHDNAVRYVALADAPLDPSAAAEASLLRLEPSFLRLVYHDAHWRVFEVRDATPPAEGARMTAWDSTSVDLDAPRTGRVLVRVRWTPYWRLAQGSGCVAPAGAWTELRLTHPGHVRLQAAFSLSRVRATSPRCTGPDSS